MDYVFIYRSVGSLFFSSFFLFAVHCYSLTQNICLLFALRTVIKNYIKFLINIKWEQGSN